MPWSSRMNWYVSPVPEKLVSDCGRMGRFPPPFTATEQFVAGESNLYRAGTAEIDPFIDADIFCQDFGSDLHCRCLGVRDLPDPVLLPVVGKFIADGFEQFCVGS